jgi:hypothetical protein
MPSDNTRRKKGTGYIVEKTTKTKGKRYNGKIVIDGKKYFTKTYGSREQVQTEFDQIIINNQ